MAHGSVRSTAHRAVYMWPSTWSMIHRPIFFFHLGRLCSLFPPACRDSSYLPCAWSTSAQFAYGLVVSQYTDLVDDQRLFFSRDFLFRMKDFNFFCCRSVVLVERGRCMCTRSDGRAPHAFEGQCPTPFILFLFSSGEMMGGRCNPPPLTPCPPPVNFVEARQVQVNFLLRCNLNLKLTGTYS